LAVFYDKVKVDSASERKLYCNSANHSMTQSPNLGLDGKTAVIIGGASGIGLAIARTCAAAGALVKIFDLNGERAEAAAQEITASGGKALAHVCDLADEANSAIGRGGIVANGCLDMLVNNVGMANIGTVETTSAADFERVMRVNVSRYFYAMKAVMGHMRDAGGGVILNMASIAGSAGLADLRLFHQQGRGDRHDVFRGARFSETQRAPQLYLAGAHAHPIRRWLPAPHLSGPRGGDVQSAIGRAAHRAHGQTRGGRHVLALPLFRPRSFYHRVRLSAGWRVLQSSRLIHGSRRMRIDSHQHFWRFNPVRDVWIADAMAVLRRDCRPDDLAPELEAPGIDATGVVQTDQSEDETHFLLDLADRHPFIAGVAGWVDQRARNLARRLEYFSRFDKVRGFCHVVQGEEDGFLLREDFRRGVARLAEISRRVKSTDGRGTCAVPRKIQTLCVNSPV
jgi:NAD(P)-dependent dehydrogenase (short-subunit alcohol dehydrogenase family)